MNTGRRRSGGIFTKSNPLAGSLLSILILLIAACEGPRGPQGPPGSPGGLMCWDVNGNAVADPIEDRNNDGYHDALDCRGPLGPREIVISAHEMDPEFQQTVFSPVKARRGLTPVIKFTDGADKLLLVSTRVPDNWDQVSSFKVTLIWSTPVTSGTMLWNVSYSPAALAENVESVTNTGVGLGGTASPVAGGLTKSSFSISPDKLSRGDLLTMSIRRVPMAATDTIEDDVDLYQVVISYLPVGGSELP